ncbi:MAG: hypothetical protein U1E67_05530 [Hyphomicrobiales bacterium]
MRAISIALIAMICSPAWRRRLSTTIVLLAGLSAPAAANHCGKDFLKIVAKKTDHITYKYYRPCLPYLSRRDVSVAQMCSKCMPFFVNANALANWLAPKKSCLHATSARAKNAAASLFSLQRDIQNKYFPKCK